MQCFRSSQKGRFFGYPAIFFLLVGGIVGVPVPDQLLLVISGYLVLTGALSLGPTLLVAVLGSIVGITLSYALGRCSGSYLSRVRFANTRLQNARRWFERFGGWTLVFGYFIPGIRNLIGFTSGMMRLRVQYFARYAYAGAIISSLTCVCAGYFLGTQANWMLASVSRVALVPVGAASLFLIRC
ncbi:MAG: DedA family protein [Acidobacteria bacterium]|nr:MAG: DedA family protein [Acidobacteriota bacterium]